MLFGILPSHHVKIDIVDILDAFNPIFCFFMGSIFTGMGIYDAMKLCKADISTVCFGLAASMGAFLLASGTKGKRFCMPNARVMIHQPLGTAGGKVSPGVCLAIYVWTCDLWTCLTLILFLVSHFGNFSIACVTFTNPGINENRTSYKCQE